MARASFDDTLNAIYSAAVTPSEWCVALEAVADHVGGSGAMIVRNDLIGSNGAIVVGRLREDLSHLYLREYSRNPLVLAIARHGRTGRAELTSSLLKKASIEKTAFHADILLPQRIVDQIAVPHGSLSRAGSTGGFAVTLTQSQMDNAVQSRECFARLVPHLSRAFDLSVEVAARLDAHHQASILLDLLPSAALVLDRSRRIIRTNSAAEALIMGGDGLCTDNGLCLAASLPGENRRLQDALRAALSAAGPTRDETGFQQALAIHRPSSLPALLLILTPLPLATFVMSEALAPGAGLLVQIVDSSAPLDGRTKILRTVYGFTLAEARVAVLVASGLTAPQVARALSLSPATIRTHLSRSFDKTGTRSQVALARFIGAFAIPG